MHVRHLAAPVLAAILLGAAGAPALAHEGNVLGASELNPALPQEATAPALCGPLH